MKRRSARTRGGQSFNRLIPNMLTLLALCAGITAMRYALDGSWGRSVIAVLVAGVLDGLDGRIARALGATSRFGAELDSLSDFVAFGVAPGFIIYLWSLHAAGGLGWALALLFAVCCALRLARFNTRLDSTEDKPAWAQNYFEGVPAPGGAGLALLPLVFSLQFGEGFFGSPAVTGFVLVSVAALMVSQIPTPAFKRVKVPARYVVFVLLAVAAMAAFLISTPWATLAVVGLIYLASIPYAAVIYRRREQLQDQLGEPEAPPAGDEDDEEAEEAEEAER